MKALYPFVLCVTALLFVGCDEEYVALPELILSKDVQLQYPGNGGQPYPGTLTYLIKGSEMVYINPATAPMGLKLLITEQAMVEPETFPAQAVLSTVIPAGYDYLKVHLGSSDNQFWTGAIHVKIGSREMTITDEDLDNMISMIPSSDPWNIGSKVIVTPIDIAGLQFVGHNSHCLDLGFTVIEILSGLSKHAGKSLTITLDSGIAKDDDTDIAAFGGNAFFLPNKASGMYDAIGTRGMQNILYTFSTEGKVF